MNWAQYPGKAIEQAIDPLRTALEQLKTDGEALSLVTFRGWLKPLLIASAVILGAGGSTWAVATILANQITGQLTDLQILNQQISTAQETLDRLPKGITFAVSKGKKYVVASQIGDPYKTESGEMAVEIK